MSESMAGGTTAIVVNRFPSATLGRRSSAAGDADWPPAGRVVANCVPPCSSVAQPMTVRESGSCASALALVVRLCSQRFQGLNLQSRNMRNPTPNDLVMEPSPEPDAYFGTAPPPTLPIAYRLPGSDQLVRVPHALSGEESSRPHGLSDALQIAAHFRERGPTLLYTRDSLIRDDYPAITNPNPPGVGGTKQEARRSVRLPRGRLSDDIAGLLILVRSAAQLGGASPPDLVLFALHTTSRNLLTLHLPGTSSAGIRNSTAGRNEWMSFRLYDPGIPVPVPVPVARLSKRHCAMLSREDNQAPSIPGPTPQSESLDGLSAMSQRYGHCSLKNPASPPFLHSLTFLARRSPGNAYNAALSNVLLFHSRSPVKFHEAVTTQLSIPLWRKIARRRGTRASDASRVNVTLSPEPGCLAYSPNTPGETGRFQDSKWSSVRVAAPPNETDLLNSDEDLHMVQLLYGTCAYFPPAPSVRSGPSSIGLGTVGVRGSINVVPNPNLPALKCPAPSRSIGTPRAYVQTDRMGLGLGLTFVHSSLFCRSPKSYGSGKHTIQILRDRTQDLRPGIEEDILLVGPVSPTDSPDRSAGVSSKYREAFYRVVALLGTQ
ncbi:hypothetical protein GLOTRDRAFT_95256 [Gloeophyllum trabeum ATCC 11539]|uniref:Uncharacterized protein n=1 Tax=Gloeophyllum trabeum (strain ATCC 11539 / FP-39264 / Madison 617) TaxID=670483 RepID=S7RGB8_GLOTA|nr:uncharacterized protein GLOTRDRAFT_95256 [Gloeophyllum trabeum ATCC 11539]EPQ53275.1 hypothetical protein GLOTRDRAFT_95256 [Gloeophyllum trabeum ATCC 11539]